MVVPLQNVNEKVNRNSLLIPFWHEALGFSSHLVSMLDFILISSQRY